MTTENRPVTAERGPFHVVRIKHDAESHEIENCHDDCRAEVVCMGTTDRCRIWWECTRCRKVMERLGDQDWRYDDRLDERGKAHGVEHQHIDGRWMTEGSQCFIDACDEHDAGDLVAGLPDGEYPVDLEWEEGYVTVHLIRVIRPGGGSDG